jgi:hypothetical protein
MILIFLIKSKWNLMYLEICFLIWLIKLAHLLIEPYDWYPENSVSREAEKCLRTFRNIRITVLYRPE